MVNCAAYTFVDQAEQEKELADQINHLAVRELAEIVKEQKAKLIHISTDYVFNGESKTLYTENDEADPINAYGLTKLNGERAVQEVMANNAVIIRVSWLYSEFGKNFVKTILKAAREGRELRIVSDQIGSPTYASDLAEVVLKLIDQFYYTKWNKTEIYHYSNEGDISWYVFAKEICKVSGLHCRISPVTTDQYPTSAKRPRHTTMDCRKIVEIMHLPVRNYKDSLQKFLISYEESSINI